MKLIELVEQIEKANPDVMKGLPKNKAVALLRATFKQINDTLAGTEEGVLPLPGLGRFRVRKVQHELKGELTTLTQIVFIREAKL